MPNIVKITTIINPLNLIAPHSCRGCRYIGNPLCNRCKNYILKNHFNFCPNCHTKNINGKCQKCKNLPPIFIVGSRSGLLDQLIHELKYSSVRAIAKPLSEILNHTLPNIKGPTVIVPLPTINRHIRERGLDHTAIISKYLSLQRPNCHTKKVLTRNKNTTQVGSDKKTRIAQATKAYSINPKIKINPNTTYILFDDVWTTGASMRAAIKKLRQAGAKKIIVSLLAVS